MKILITGASGFIGGSLTRALVSYGEMVRVAVRKPIADLGPNFEQVQISSLNAEQDWSEALEDIDVVVHCAALVHVMKETSDNPLPAYRAVNVEGTRRLAQQAADSSIKRFIFLSSIKVNGESTLPGAPFHPTDQPQPTDPYGISKWEAEQELMQLCIDAQMNYTIIRPVLVYGPAVKANFAQLIRVVSKGIPLPLGSTKNKRSIVALNNLTDLICTCINHPAAANQTFLVSDDNDLSTTDLVRSIARCQCKKPVLLPIPPSILRAAAAAFGKRATADRLLGNLQVDISQTCETLGWRPPVSTEDALQETVDYFTSQPRNPIPRSTIS